MPERHPSEAILGASAAVAALREQVRRIAAFDGVGNPHVPTVLLEGATGTGKGLVARVLHDSGARARNPFIDVNCAAIPETMLEAELFGFEAGAFTDARRAKPGLFEAASTGTLFLDEIDSLSLALQAKLLKAIEEKSLRRLGAVATRRVDVKLIAATQHELEGLVAAGRFRADLYHRLAVLVLRLPPLRERGDDAVHLAEHLLGELTRAHALPPRRLDDAARAWLRTQAWPGNVRELAHLIERVTLLGPEGTIDDAALRAVAAPSPRPVAATSPTAPPATASAPKSTSASASEAAAARDPAAPIGVDDRDEDAEATRIRTALRRAGGNVVAAAQILGLGRNALRYRMRRLGIAKPSLADLADPLLAREAPTPSPAEPPLSPASIADAERALDEATGAPAWEVKRVAALAVDIVFPSPTDDEPRFEPWTASARWKSAIGEKLRGFGAHLIDETATRTTAAFGLPRALEQTALRAVQAGLALQHMAALAAPPRPELRVAIHLGDVRFDPISAAERVLALGDTLALPERLLGHAGAGEVLVSARVARQVAQACRLEPRTLQLGPRGEDAVIAHAVVAAGRRSTAVEQPREPAATPFVGRQRELETLVDAFRTADAGQGQVAFVAGEAGLGKSRLLAELGRRLGDRSDGPQHFWIEGRCASYGATTPFLPIADGLRRFFAIDDRDDEAGASAKIAATVAAIGDDLEWTLPYLGEILSLSSAGSDATSAMAALDSASRRSETFRALRALLLRAAESRCVVLVVEDLHWIDRTSEEFLGFVVDAIPALRALLLCTHRPGYEQPFGDRSYYLRLTLRPLSEDEMGAITRSLLGSSELPAELRALVARKAEGNPFFVEEMTRSLLEDGSLRSADGRIRLTRELAELSIPDTIQEVLTARIDRLADEARHAIQVASVIGREFALRLLERIAEAGAGVRTQLDELRSVELIYEKALHPELAYMFKHALTHDVAYQSVVAERRRGLHRTIGDAIEELYADRLEEHYETLAHHFARGEDWQRALDYHDRAAEKAAAKHATQAVVEHCRHALAIADRLSDQGSSALAATRARLEARLGLACFYTSDFAESGRAFERAAAAGGTGGDSSLLVALAAQSHFWAHDYDTAEEEISRVLAATETGEAGATGATSQSGERRPVSEGEVGGRQAARAMALNVRGFRRAVLDADLAGADRDYAEAMHLAKGRVEAIEASVGFNQTLFAEWTGDYRHAIALAERVMDAGRRLGLAHLVVWPTWFIGKSKCCLGEYGGAVAALEEGYQFCDRIGDRAWKSRLLNTLGWCLAEIGCHDLAREHDLGAASLARELGDPEIVANSEINLAGDCLALGRIDEALGYLEPIEDTLSRPGDNWMRWRYALHTFDMRARIESQRRAPDRALTLAGRELEGATRHRAPKLEARALVTAGRALLDLERPDEAEERLTQALAVAERIAAPRLAWHAHDLLARLHARRGRAEDAERHRSAHQRLVRAAADSIADAALRRRFLAAIASAAA